MIRVNRSSQMIVVPAGYAIDPRADENPSLTRTPDAEMVVRLDHSIDSPERRYGLELLGQVLGIPVAFNGSARADVYCGFDPLLGRAARVWIRPEFEADWAGRPPTLSKMDGIPVLHGAAPPARLLDRNRVEFDLPLATAFWATLMSERHATHRDAHGRVPAAASFLGMHDLQQDPPIHRYATLLASLLWPEGMPGNLFPRWPEGKKWAAIITHDVDRPERAPLGRALLKNLFWPRSQRRRQTLYALLAEIRSRGLWDALFAGPIHRREWDFQELCRQEQSAGVRSAFFFSVVNRRLGHRCDVDYDLQKRRYRHQIRRLKLHGFEVGLHAAYSTRWGWPPVADQVERMGSLLGDAPVGVRHHYLQVHHDDPGSTLASHIDAGLSYDSSIGFNDAPGFRAGLALPFHPLLPTGPASRQFVELPMTFADMHLPTHDSATSIQMLQNHLNRVRELGGLAVLNWHVGHWHSDPAWRDAYLEACSVLCSDPTVWVPTPADLAAWWIDRSRAMHTAAGGEEAGIDSNLSFHEWPVQCVSVDSSLAAGSLPGLGELRQDAHWLAESA